MNGAKIQKLSVPGFKIIWLCFSILRSRPAARITLSMLAQTQGKTIKEVARRLFKILAWMISSCFKLSLLHGHCFCLKGLFRCCKNCRGGLSIGNLQLLISFISILFSGSYSPASPYFQRESIWFIYVFGAVCFIDSLFWVSDDSDVRCWLYILT